MKNLLKEILLLVLCIWTGVSVGFSQTPKPRLFRDYPFVQNLDSLTKAVYEKKNNPEAYLYGLITLEKNRSNFPGIFGQDLNTIKTLAYQLHSPLAIAMHQYLESLHLRETNLGSAARNCLEAARYFEKSKDTTGILICYSVLILQSANSQAYHIKNMQSSEYYYDRALNLGHQSKRVIDKILTICIILNFEKLVKGSQDFNKRLITIKEALYLMNNNLKTEPVQYMLYSAISGFYSRHKQPKQALEYELKLHALLKKRTSIININDSYGLGINYFDIKDYDQSASFFKETIRALELQKEPSLNLLYNSYDMLADINFINKQYDTAWMYKQKVINIQTNRYRNLKRSLFQELETQYETDQKESRNRLLVHQNNLVKLRSEQFQKEAANRLLLEQNQLAKSQHKRLQKEIENKHLVQKNQLIELKKEQYKFFLFLGFIAFFIVLILTAQLYKAISKQKEMMRFRDQLFTIIAHDMRSPMTAFEGLYKQINYLLNKGEYDQIKTLSLSIDESIKSTNLLLNNLLEWALAQNPQVTITKTLLSVRELAQNTKDLYEMVAKSRQSQIEIDVPASLQIVADKNGILLILRNLLDNALKHGQVGLILIKAGSVNQEVVIEVKSSSSVLSANALVKLQRQIKTQSTDIQRAAGLGLQLVVHFVNKHQGSIDVQSSDANGTVFTVKIPQAAV